MGRDGFSSLPNGHEKLHFLFFLFLIFSSPRRMFQIKYIYSVVVHLSYLAILSHFPQYSLGKKQHMASW